MPGNQTETAYCSTSAINPTLVQLSPAAADYSKFGAYCKLTPSTGAVIYSTECPPGSVYNSGSQPPATANPMGECDIVFQPQPGVTYTINSNHWLWPNMLPLSQCGFQDYRAYCLSDPLGYYSFNPGAADPFPTTPTYTGVSSYVSLLAINTVDDPCSVMGTCSPQNISDIYCTNYIIIGGLPICHSGGISVPDVWEIAHTSEPWTPKCSDVVQGSVTPVAYSSPLTDGPNAGATITATFTPNFGYTLAQAAQICGFTNFDWQQLITVLPLPNTFIAVGSGAQMYAPPGFLDPPPGGYTYELPDIDNAYPFYYNPNPGSTGQSELATYEPGGASGTQLLFSDGPKDSCLFGGRYAGTAACNWTSAAPGETVQFITHLVGINSDGTAHDLQIGFTWYSNNNGTSGGAAIMRGVQPMDPGSGTGGTTVTSVSETTNYQYPTAPGVPPSTLTFLDGSQVSVWTCPQI